MEPPCQGEKGLGEKSGLFHLFEYRNQEFSFAANQNYKFRIYFLVVL